MSNDELNRQLRAADAAQRAADAPWRSALQQVFDPSSEVGADDKARLLGLPGRRDFLRIGGVTVLGAALLAACGSSSNTAATTTSGGATGTTMAPTTTGMGATTTTVAGGVDDLTLARTAASLEALAIATYMAAGKSGKVSTPIVLSVATTFAGHHQQHLDALNAVIKGAGGAAITEPNAAVKKALVDPVLTDASLDEAKIVQLAFDLEGAAAQTYTFAAGVLSTPALRSTIMTIGGIEAHHRAIIGMAMKLSAPTIFPAGFEKSDNPLAGIPGALIMA